MLYWPAKLAPRRIEVMASQIDLPPTVLALLGIRTRGVFFGQNLLGPAPEARAFLVNYQELGYLTPPVALNQLLARSVVGEAEWAEARREGTSFFSRNESVIVPCAVMAIALLGVAFIPLAFY